MRRDFPKRRRRQQEQQRRQRQLQQRQLIPRTQVLESGVLFLPGCERGQLLLPKGIPVASGSAPVLRMAGPAAGGGLVGELGSSSSGLGGGEGNDDALQAALEEDGELKQRLIEALERQRRKLRLRMEQLAAEAESFEE